MPKRLKKIVHTVPTGADYGEVVYTDNWEHQGIVYSPGDSISISGERGVFRFYKYGYNSRLKSDWIDVWHEGHCFRSFRPSRVVGPKRSKNSNNRNGQGQADKPVPVCVDHKLYTAQRKPRTDCSRCWEAYRERKSEDE